MTRLSNGNCSTNGILKDLVREEGDDGSEKGVTFRIGKFIGQVTIESKCLFDCIKSTASLHSGRSVRP